MCKPTTTALFAVKVSGDLRGGEILLSFLIFKTDLLISSVGLMNKQQKESVQCSISLL